MSIDLYGLSAIGISDQQVLTTYVADPKQERKRLQREKVHSASLTWYGNSGPMRVIQGCVPPSQGVDEKSGAGGVSTFYFLHPHERLQMLSNSNIQERRNFCTSKFEQYVCSCFSRKNS